MDKLNLTEAESEGLRIAYEQGKKWGQTLTNMVNSGQVDPNKTLNILLPVDEIRVGKLPLITRFTMEFGSVRAGVVGNSAIVTLGIYTGGSSALNYTMTTNRAAKGFYILSVLFSSSAIISGGSAVVARTCQISQTAALSEAFGTGFMFLGNKAYAAALLAEGKQIPLHLRRTAYGNNYDGIAFATPGLGQSIFISEIIERIPFQQIGKTVGICFSVYAYGKAIIVAYRYTQQLITKYKLRKKREYNSKLVLKQARFLVTCFYRHSSVYRTAVLANKI